MNILYLISCFGHGRGGHFYSLKTICDEMSKEGHTVFISSVGTSTSPVLRGLENYYPFTSKFSSPVMISKLMTLIRKNNIDVIHSFDFSAFFFARIVSSMINTPVLLTKCGGPSPQAYYPKADNLTLFSTEDMQYFQDSLKHRTTNLYHIPNRVSVTDQDWSTIENIRKSLRKEAKIILRIARFSEQHRKSILDSINLVNRLVRDGVDVQLLIIGVKDQLVYKELITYESENILIYTDDLYTINASRLIGVADLVVGAGRSAMEAAMQGRVVLSPVKGLSIPILVARENIDRFLDYNFSARTEIRNISEQEEYENVKTVLKNERFFSENQKFISEYSEKYFDVSVVRQKYEDIYSKCVSCQTDFFDTSTHFYRVAKRFLRSNIRK